MPLNRPTVLVIETDSVLSQLLCLGLQRAGYDVLLAADHATALTMLAAQPVDLIFVDLFLPDQEEAAVYDAIREVSTAPILMTSMLPPSPQSNINVTFSPKPFSLHEWGKG